MDASEGNNARARRCTEGGAPYVAYGFYSVRTPYDTRTDTRTKHRTAPYNTVKHRTAPYDTVREKMTRFISLMLYAPVIGFEWLTPRCLMTDEQPPRKKDEGAGAGLRF